MKLMQERAVNPTLGDVKIVLIGKASYRESDAQSSGYWIEAVRMERILVSVP